MPEASDEPRFARMFDDHWAAVVRYAARRSRAVDPEDVAATVFTNAWRHLDDIPAHAELPWLLRTARNQVVTNWRKRHRAVVVEEVEPDTAATPDTALEMDVQAALERLSDDDREVLALAYWDQLGSRDAAAVLGCAAGTYRVRLHRARRRLRRILDPSLAAEARATDITAGGLR